MQILGLLSTVVAGIAVLGLNGQPQKGSAPNGYYPYNFSGTTFTGRFQYIENDRQELTLVYTKQTHEERFVGRLDAPCSWTDRNGALHAFGASEIPKGVLLTAFYTPSTDKSGGKPKTENRIFAISYAERDGKKLTDDQRIVIPCSTKQQVMFKAFR